MRALLLSSLFAAALPAPLHAENIAAAVPADIQPVPAVPAFQQGAGDALSVEAAQITNAASANATLFSPAPAVLLLLPQLPPEKTGLPSIQDTPTTPRNPHTSPLLSPQQDVSVNRSLPLVQETPAASDTKSNPKTHLADRLGQVESRLSESLRSASDENTGTEGAHAAGGKIEEVLTGQSAPQAYEDLPPAGPLVKLNYAKLMLQPVAWVQDPQGQTSEEALKLIVNSAFNDRSELLSLIKDKNAVHIVLTNMYYSLLSVVMSDMPAGKRMSFAVSMSRAYAGILRGIREQKSLPLDARILAGRALFRFLAKDVLVEELARDRQMGNKVLGLEAALKPISQPPASRSSSREEAPPGPSSSAEDTQRPEAIPWDVPAPVDMAALARKDIPPSISTMILSDEEKELEWMRSLLDRLRRRSLLAKSKSSPLRQDLAEQLDKERRDIQERTDWARAMLPDYYSLRLRNAFIFPRSSMLAKQAALLSYFPTTNGLSLFKEPNGFLLKADFETDIDEPAVLETVKESIESYWNGGFELDGAPKTFRVQVHIRKLGKDEPFSGNALKLKEGPSSYAWWDSIFLSRDLNFGTPAHEFGHILSLADEYLDWFDVKKRANIEIVVGKSLMGDSSEGIVSPELRKTAVLRLKESRPVRTEDEDLPPAGPLVKLNYAKLMLQPIAWIEDPQGLVSDRALELVVNSAFNDRSELLSLIKNKPAVQVVLANMYYSLLSVVMSDMPAGKRMSFAVSMSRAYAGLLRGIRAEKSLPLDARILAGRTLYRFLAKDVLVEELVKARQEKNQLAELNKLTGKEDVKPWEIPEPEDLDSPVHKNVLPVTKKRSPTLFMRSIKKRIALLLRLRSEQLIAQRNGLSVQARLSEKLEDYSRRIAEWSDWASRILTNYHSLRLRNNFIAPLRNLYSAKEGGSYPTKNGLSLFKEPGGFLLKADFETDIDEPAVLETVKKSIESYWNGSFELNGEQKKIRVQVNIRKLDKWDSFSGNALKLQEGADSHAWWESIWLSRDLDFGTPAHEFGHILGLPDEYREWIDVKKRQYVQISGSNLMGNHREGIVSPELRKKVFLLLKESRHVWTADAPPSELRGTDDPHSVGAAHANAKASNAQDAVALSPASASDAPDIARFMLESAPRFLPACFGPRIGSALERLSALKGTIFSHEHVKIARSNGRAVGMLLGYTGRQKKDEELRTGLLLLGSLRTSLLGKIPALLRLQNSIGKIPSDSFYISNVAVDPEARSLGIGNVLIADAEETARALGLETICLDVETDNARAIKLYKRLGFSIERTSLEIMLDGRGFSMHRMVKPL